MSMRTMAARVDYLGGSQINRINKQKLKSFHWALKNDYNSRIIKVNDKGAFPCLITTSSGGLKSDYDKKVLSVDFDAGLDAGDTFEVLDDGTHWMVYLPVLTETAYLRSEIIRCRYQLEVNGKSYWVYFQGPTETDLRWFIKNQINVNELNLSGTIYIKNDENTKNHFKRFTHLEMDGHTWEVQVTDSITVPGILELEVQEYYDNTVAALPRIIEDESTSTNVIKGQTVVKQDSTDGYMIDEEAYDPEAEWHVENNDRVRVSRVIEGGRICEVNVFPGAIGTFDLYYGNEQFVTVTVDWAKPVIQGPTEVYPYDVHTYWLKGVPEGEEAKFALSNDMAEIIDVGRDYCKVDVTSSKSGGFNVLAAYGDEEYLLSVKVKSL